MALSPQARSLSPPGLFRSALVLAGLLLSLPFFTLLSSWFSFNADAWQHLASTVLAEYLVNTLYVAVVAVGVANLLALVPAYLTATYATPARTVLVGLCLAPLAIPPYISAIAYAGLFETGGLLARLPLDFRSRPGAGFVLGAALYPYVFLLARAAFRDLGRDPISIARTLGAGHFEAVVRVAGRAALPAVLGGSLLVVMETVADYGSAQYLGVPTLSVGIYRTWFGMGDGATAAQLASTLLFVTACLLACERVVFRRRRLGASRAELVPASAGMKALAIATCLPGIMLGFLLPCGQLLAWTLVGDAAFDWSDFERLLRVSVIVALTAGCLVALVGMLLAFCRRQLPGVLASGVSGLAQLGYGLPGTVIAVGLLLPLSLGDRWLNGVATALDVARPGLVFTGSVFALLYAYLVRFLPLSLRAIDDGMQRIRPVMDDAARTLGLSPGRLLVRLHLPILSSSAAIAVLLVFIETLKELPATLLLRPFDFTTLAVKTFELASDERLAEAAPFALVIVATGLVPVVLFDRLTRTPAAT